MAEARVGVIGGSGLYEIDGLSDLETLSVDTPFGKPSDEIAVGTLSGVRVAFLPRHGRGHRISPSELPARANVWAMKSLGVTHLLSVSAVGSLREELAPREIVIPDQILDRTKGVRPASFLPKALSCTSPLQNHTAPSCGRSSMKRRKKWGQRCIVGGRWSSWRGPSFRRKRNHSFTDESAETSSG